MPTCTACGYPEPSPTFTMIYKGRFEVLARRAFRKDAGRLAGMGYRWLPGSIGWAPNPREANAGIFFAFGVVGLLIMRLLPTRGSLTVIYERWDLTPEKAGAEPGDSVSRGS